MRGMCGGEHVWGVCLVGGHAWCGSAGGVAGGMRGRGACVAGETATAVGGTHPTGMHPCLL